VLAKLEIRFGRYRFHPTQGLSRGRRDLRVTPKSLAVLRVLIDRSGEIVTKEELFRSVWPETAVSDAALTTCIQELRRALSDDARHPRYIETVHRRGFRFLLSSRADEPEEPPRVPGRRPPRSPRPIVGRESALAQLSDALTRTCQGEHRMVFVAGPAGIGKTTLLDAWLETIADRSAIRVMRGECLEHHGAGEAYQPLLEALTRLCRQTMGDACVAVLRRCAPTWLAQLPAFQTRGERGRLERRTAGVTTERMRRELTDALEVMSESGPLVLCIDDLHWSDASTRDWIASFARRGESTRVLVVGTYRPGEVVSGRPSAKSLVDDLGVRGLCVEVALSPLNLQSIRDYVFTRFPPAPSAGDALEELVAFVHRRTEGNALFVVNALNDLIARHVLIEHEGRWVTERLDATAGEIPADVRRTIEHQIERLGDDEQRLLEVASAVVGTCSVATVAAGAGISETDVEATCVELARRQSFLRAGPAVEWPDGTWTATFEFLHSLYREVLSARLAPGRRVEVHRAMGNRLETAYGERAAELALELSVHFEEARDFNRAVLYLQQAAETARRRSAHALARDHYRRALELLDRLPPGDDRDEREVALQIGLGQVLMQTSGWGDRAVEAAYTRARQLSESRPGPPLFSALWNLWIFCTTRGDLHQAGALADRLFALARQLDESELLLQAHHAQWSTFFTLGDLRGTDVHARRGIDLYDACTRGVLTFGGHDAGICARLFRARALAFAGRSDTAVTMCDEALAMARDLDHPFTLAFCLMHVAAVHEARRDADLSRQHASEARRIAQDHGLGLMIAWASCFLGWATVQRGEVSEGKAMLEESVATADATGSVLFRPHLLALLASARLTEGSIAEARATLAEAITSAERTGERFYLAELHRLHGEVRVAGRNDTEQCLLAEADFQTAIQIAEEQGAVQLALRATISLVRLWQRMRRQPTGTHMLADIRRRIAEGASLPDAVEADELIAGGQ
jgi:DNA-binding winged helix-turn-helix (wHTH) protein/predicted ATPase